MSFVNRSMGLRMVSFRIPLILILGFATELAFATQTAPSSRSQADNSKEAQAAYQAGTAAAANGDYKTAEAQLQKVVHLAPQIAEGHSALGAVLMRLGQFTPAIKELERALALKPADSFTQVNLAMAYEQTGAYKKAIPLFEKVEAGAQRKSASDPSHSVPSGVLAAHARSLAATGQLPAAIAKMKTAVDESPRDAELHDQLGTMYAQQETWPSAINEFRTAIELDSQLAAPHMHLGVVLLIQQRVPAAAVAELITASQLAPNDAITATELGKAYVANDEDQKAIAAFQHAISLDSSATEAKYQLALALQRTGRDQDAVPLLRQVIEADPKNAEAGASLGFALLHTGDAKDAIPFLERALEQHANSPTAHQNLAAAYMQMNEVDQAIAVLSSGLKTNPQSFELHYNLGLALKLKDDNAGAIPELETAAKLNPSAYEPHYTLGVLYMQDGRYEDAARELAQAMKLHPDNADGWATLGNVYRKIDKLPEATAALREAIRQMPDQPDPHLTLAAVLAQQGQTAEAAAERKKGAELERVAMNRQRATVSTNSGNSLLKKGQVTDAIERYQEALSDDPNYAEAHRGLADALERQGKTAEATAERQKADELEQPQPR